MVSINSINRVLFYYYLYLNQNLKDEIFTYKFISVIFLAVFYSKFQGVNWGTSISELTSKYPDTQWEIETDGEMTLYITEDYIGGLTADVCYFFIKTKLKGGIYTFKENHTSNNLYYKDFTTISSKLNQKYTMETQENWNNTT